MNKKLRGLISFKYLLDLSSTDLAHQAIFMRNFNLIFGPALGRTFFLTLREVL